MASPTPPKFIADRVRQVIDHADPYKSPNNRLSTWIDCPSITSLCTSNDIYGNVGNSAISLNPHVPVIERNEPWPFTELRQLNHIIFACYHYRLTASDIGIFLVETMYRRDQNLGDAVTTLVDAGGSYSSVGQSIVMYLGLLSRGTLLSEHLVPGDTSLRPKWTVHSQNRASDFSSLRRRRSDAPHSAAAARARRYSRIRSEYPESQKAPNVQAVQYNRQNQVRSLNGNSNDSRSRDSAATANDTDTVWPQPEYVPGPVPGSVSYSPPYPDPSPSQQSTDQPDGSVPRPPSPQTSKPRWPFYDDSSRKHEPKNNPHTNKRHSLGCSYELGTPRRASIRVGGSIRKRPAERADNPSGERKQQQREENVHEKE